MKKINPILLSLLILFMLVATPCQAKASNESITYLDDGSYFVTTITDTPTLQNPSGAQTYAAAITSTTKTKTSNYYNSSHELMWYVKVTGSFTYTKDSATCKSASVTAESLSSSWKMSKSSAARSGATAYASATATQYMAGVPIGSIDKLVPLTCHPGGTFS